MLHTAGEAESTAGHGDRRTGAGRPRYMALDWENRHVRVRLERPLHQAWVKLRESGQGSQLKPARMPGAGKN